MKVIECFKSIDGEGKRAGLPTTFVRLAGCNLRCKYCDTAYSFDTSTAKELSAHDILEICKDLRVASITITGGEPLVHPHIPTLLVEMNKSHLFDINVETN